MKSTEQSRVVGLLGVGFDHTDGHVRVTQSNSSQVLMGSKECHQVLQKTCLQIEEMIRESGRVISDYSPEELMELIGEIH